MAACRRAYETEWAAPIQAAVPVQTAKQEPAIVPSTDAERLKRRHDTYKQWNSKKSSLQLATAGFIHTGIADKVECQSCGISMYSWQEEEDPLTAHKKYAPDCEFMLTYFPQIKAPPKPKKILNVKHTNYADYESRLKSYDSWPVECVAQRPDMMARSGFFYVGSADRARCFHCGVTLRDWDNHDYPPCAHRQWSEHCPFVQHLDVEGMRAEIEEREREERPLNQPGMRSHPKQFADFQARLTHSPNMMARSGVFYEGVADRERCFLCGVTIENWVNDDYPPCAHRERASRCPFVQQLNVDAMKAEIEEAEMRVDNNHLNSNPPDCVSQAADLDYTRPKSPWRSPAVVGLSVRRSRLPGEGLEVFQHGNDSGHCESWHVHKMEE